MCIIFLKPEDALIPHDILRSGWERNPHGWGIMRPGRLQPLVRKGVKSFDQFLNNYTSMFEKYACAIHFRASTHGKKDEDNAHPYHVKDDLWMMHNGIFPGIPIIEQERSDTYHFAQMLGKMSFDIRGPEMDYILSNQSGDQRLLFMDQKGFTLIAEDGWFRDANGIYYSNHYGWAVPPVERKPLYINNYKVTRIPRSMNEKFKIREINTEDLDDYRFWWQKQMAPYDKEKELGSQDDVYVPTDIEGTKRELIDNIMDFDKHSIVEFCKTDPSLMVDVIKSTLPRVN